MRLARFPRLLLGILYGFALASPTSAQYQITYTTTDPTTDAITLWRVEARDGAQPENLNSRLDAVAILPGGHLGPISVSPDGGWYVFRSERFDQDSQGWSGLTIAKSDFSSVETIRANSQTIHNEGLAQVLAGGQAIVYDSGDGPHSRDLFIVRHEATSWTTPLLLTGASTFAFNTQPTLSPDGTHVAFDASNESFPSTAICEVGLDGTGFRVVITKDNVPTGFQAGPAVHSPSYAPDSSIVFEAEWGGPERVWRLPSTGGQPSLVNPTFTNDNSPVALPDGRIASLHLPVSNHQIKLMDANGANAIYLTPSSLNVADIGLGAGPLLTGSAPNGWEMH